MEPKQKNKRNAQWDNYIWWNFVFQLLPHSFFMSQCCIRSEPNEAVEKSNYTHGLRHRPRRGYLRWGGDGEAVQPEK